jgi:hypothetical protein
VKKLNIDNAALPPAAWSFSPAVVPAAVSLIHLIGCCPLANKYLYKLPVAVDIFGMPFGGRGNQYSFGHKKWHKRV